MSSANSDSFTSSFSTEMLFISFYYLISVPRVSNTKSDESRHSCLVPDLREKVSAFHHWVCSLWACIDGLFNIQVCSFYTQFIERGFLNHKLILMSVKSFFWLYCDGCCCCLSLSCVQILCDPTDSKPAGSSVCRILQARLLERATISFSRRSSWPRHQTCTSCISSSFFIIEPPGKPLTEMIIWLLFFDLLMWQCDVG